MTVRKVFSILMIALLCSAFYLSIQEVYVQGQEPTLADTINCIVSNIQATNSSWAVLYSQIFGLRNQTVFDDAIMQALSLCDYTEVIFIARLAELNGYSSQVINESVRTALENIPMGGSLPITYVSDEPAVPSSFIVYDRYMINAYRYAQELNVPGWNITQAYQDFATAYLRPPQNSQSGEMLWLNPAKDYAASFKSRYYDEYAETLDTFLEFALNGANAYINYNGASLSATSFADDTWLNTQNLWTGNYYDYSGRYEKGVECEMGNFAQSIAEYRNFRGDMPYFDRVVSDLQYTLLLSGFNSPAWGTTGVVKHANASTTTSNELRLQETLGVLIALQMLYPSFSDTAKDSFRSMLPAGWQGLLSSSLYNGAQFRLFNDSDSPYTDDASFVGAMTLFLYGIIPDTGYLAVNASNEAYQDYRTCFPTSEWSFDYKNNIIRIPVIHGNLTFTFGSENVTQNLPSNGVYDIQFAHDWNSITSVTKMADINTATLQPVALQPISRATPSPSSTTSQTQSPNPNTIETPSNPTSSPASSPSARQAQESSTANLTPTEILALILSIGGIAGVTAVYSLNKKKKQSHQAVS